jgi:hypothetical protein
MERERVHYYHADGSTLGGTLDHPLGSIIPSQAEISLPSAGGFTSKHTGEFNYGEIVRISHAYTHALGSVSKKTGGFTTLVSTVVEGLNILEVVTADRVVGQVSVEHPRKGYHPVVTFVGSQFVNLRIAGVPVEPKINRDILVPVSATPDKPYPEKPVFHDEDFRKAVRTQHGARKSHVAPREGHVSIGEWIKERYGWVESEQALSERGFLHCSLVDSIPVPEDFPGESYGHCVHIPEVGRFYFGEVAIDYNSYRITMVQAELGCPVHGVVSVATGGSNGHTSG